MEVTMLLIISNSLAAQSNSRILAECALLEAQKIGLVSKLVDMRDFPLTLCDGDESYSNPNVEKLSTLLREASAVIFSTPIYNYDVSATLKNLIEHVGGELADKVIGFMCAAGGSLSYMSPLSFLNSLMLDFRTLIVPRFVYASRDSFSEGAVADTKIKDRIKELVTYTQNLSFALKVQSDSAVI